MPTATLPAGATAGVVPRSGGGGIGAPVAASEAGTVVVVDTPDLGPPGAVEVTSPDVAVVAVFAVFAAGRRCEPLEQPAPATAATATARIETARVDIGTLNAFPPFSLSATDARQSPARTPST